MMVVDLTFTHRQKSRPWSQDKRLKTLEWNDGLSWYHTRLMTATGGSPTRCQPVYSSAGVIKGVLYFVAGQTAL